MRETIYLYSENFLLSIVQEILIDYKVTPLTLDHLSNKNFKNNNILLLFKNNLTSEIKEPFFSNNKTLIFLSKKQQSHILTKPNNANFFYGKSSVKKFLDEIKTYFISKKIILKNIEILGEKITNINSGLSLLLTPLEKKILTPLLENNKVNRDFLLEEILKIKKNIETKTIETHLTRIRKKLIKIESEIQISSKDDTFYLNF